MKRFFLLITLSVYHLLAGCNAATGDVGQACLAGNTCTDSNAYCVTSTSLCACKQNFLQKGTVCGRIFNKPCGDGLCLDNGVCSSGSCTCDTSKKFAAGSSGDGTCSCSSGYMLQNGLCKKVIEQSCTAVSECYSSTGIVCTGGKCQCDTTNNFATGTAGATSCSCATGYSLQNGVCKKVIEQTCTAVSECYSSTGIVCTGSKCQCDTTKNFATGTAGDTSCSCPTGSTLQNGACKKVIEQTCTAVSECYSSTGIVCTGSKCQCDTTKNFATGTAGDTSCSCPTGSTLQNGACKKVIEQACTVWSECYSSPGIACTGNKCQCDPTNNFATGTPGGTSCSSCVTGYSFQDGACKKTLDQSCSAVSECYSSTGIVCTGGKCLCDTTNHFVAGTAGAISCSCDTVAGYFSQNGACKKVVEGACTTVSECYSSTGIVCTGGKCQCDTTNNFAAGASGAASCSCDTGYRLQNGVCKKVIEQSCTAVSECYTSTGIVCTGGKCQCDTTNHFATGTAGAISCSCDTGYQIQNGVCKKKIDQTCSATTECYSALGIVCSSGKCICDGNLHLTTPGTAGQVSCSCATGYRVDSSGSCRAVIGTSCSDGAACIDNALCDQVSKTCKCDTSNNFAQGSSGDTSCSCSTGSVPRSDGKCGLKVGGSCADVCVSNGVCTSGLCACQTNFYNQTDGSCSGGIAVVSSIFLLAATVFLTFLTGKY